jgi:hypothetical protein
MQDSLASAQRKLKPRLTIDPVQTNSPRLPGRFVPARKQLLL